MFFWINVFHMFGNPWPYDRVQTCIVIYVLYPYKFRDSSFSQVWMDFLFWIGSGNFEKFLASQESGCSQKLVKSQTANRYLYLDNMRHDTITLLHLVISAIQHRWLIGICINAHNNAYNARIDDQTCK